MSHNVTIPGDTISVREQEDRMMTEEQEDALYRTLLALDEKVGRLLAAIEETKVDVSDCATVQELLDALDHRL
jgi:anti-sigma28 factor (negative regulator of flagellin synthesis)